MQRYFLKISTVVIREATMNTLLGIITTGITMRTESFDRLSL